MHVNVRKLVLGRPLANREFSEQKIGAFEGVAVMGLDGLGSSAYGPEAALTILIPLGAASLSYIGWVMARSWRCLRSCLPRIGRRSAPTPAMAAPTSSPGKTWGRMRVCSPPPR